MYYFYVLKSKKKYDWFYKGSTINLKRRLKEHNNGENTSSRPFRPYDLVYYEAYRNIKSAWAREDSVKRSGSVWISLMKRIKRSLKE